MNITPVPNFHLASLSLTLICCLAAPTGHANSLSGNTPVTAKLYVALEGAGAVAVINADNGEVLKKIDLSAHGAGMDQTAAMPMLMAHNIQVAPDGNSVWVTANVMEDDEAHNVAAGEDELIVINPHDDTIVQRMPLGMNLHLSHVALTMDSLTAIAASQEAGILYKIDAANFIVMDEMATAEGAEPHGLRISPDGKTAYIAMLGSGALGVLDIESFSLEELPLDGKAVQAGVTPDGRYALASLYDTKQLAVMDCTTRELQYVQLPEGAVGPVQIYPSPDSRFMYVADQGYYFDQPEGSQVYVVDLDSMSLQGAISAGRGPHGIVVAPTGDFAYVTNLLSDDVSVLDLDTGLETRRINVGAMPNGISMWTKDSGGTP